jgi:hypothetical protein
MNMHVGAEVEVLSTISAPKEVHYALSACSLPPVLVEDKASSWLLPPHPPPLRIKPRLPPANTISSAII